MRCIQNASSNIQSTNQHTNFCGHDPPVDSIADDADGASGDLSPMARDLPTTEEAAAFIVGSLVWHLGTFEEIVEEIVRSKLLCVILYVAKAFTTLLKEDESLVE